MPGRKERKKEPFALGGLRQWCQLGEPEQRGVRQAPRRRGFLAYLLVQVEVGKQSLAEWNHIAREQQANHENVCRNEVGEGKRKHS